MSIGRDTTGRARRNAARGIALLSIGVWGLAVSAAADPCVVPDNGSGTVTLPPEGCEYLSPDEVHMIIDGLPPGTEIELDAIHKDFICGRDGAERQCSAPLPPGICEDSGGDLGGNLDCFDSVAQIGVQGTGDLTGFARTLLVPLGVEVHSAPRNPGDPVQSFDTEMVQLDGAIFGDPDFAFLQIRAGRDQGLPSPGHTTLVRLPSGDFNVDSFFDVAYRIDFQGAPGGALDGLSGTTTGTIRMATGEPTTTTTTTTEPPPTTTTTTLPVSHKVALCHKGGKTLSVGASAVPAHLAHGDSLGACE